MDEKWFYAHLMVEFNLKTDLPVSIHVYSEDEDEITMIGNEYICIASMEWKCCKNKKDVSGFEILCKILESQLKEGLYNSCYFTYHDKQWTVEECKKHIK